METNNWALGGQDGVSDLSLRGGLICQKREEITSAKCSLQCVRS